MIRNYQAVFFDWDGTAVMSRRADASEVLAAMTDVMRSGVKLVIISGTTYENICGGRLGELLPPEVLANLYLGLGRGNFNYGFDSHGQVTPIMDNTPDWTATMALHDAAYLLHKKLLESYGLPTDIVFTRPNYCKIDLMADTGRNQDTLFLQAEEVARVNALLTEHHIRGGLAGLLRLAEDIGRKSGLPLKATTDAKYLEVGFTTKSDNVNRFMEQFAVCGITAAGCSFWGDEYGAIANEVWGSDQQMITPLTEAGDFFNVSETTLPLPSKVQHLGGGPERFIAFLKELAHFKQSYE